MGGKKKNKPPFDVWNIDPSRLMFSKIANPDQQQPFVSAQEYIPEMMAFERDFVLVDLKLAIEAGLEYTQECLARHDQELGRTTRKNESWAKIMEQDITKMKQALERIKKYEVCDLQ